MISAILKHNIADNILLLQGPVGYFFSDLSLHLKQCGAKNIIKVNFNTGDDFFYKHKPIVRFKRPFYELKIFYNNLIDNHNIHAVYLFGDCRFIHQVAIEVFKHRNIPYYVFEEGYIRPDYITLEQGGVNGNSSLRVLSINKISDNQTHIPSVNITQKPIIGYGSFRKMVLFGFIYFSICRIFRYRYPFYVHHKSVSPTEILIWIWSFIRKYYYAICNKKHQKYILNNHHKNYYFVPLQVYNDAQIFYHSHFPNITDFIETVLVSFATHAPKNTYLVLKHHPLDRGHKHYGRFIKNLSKKLGIKNRVYYLHQISLPQMLRSAKGVITINSTVGLSALYHEAPVKVLGKAFYDIAGLTYQGSLERFWTTPGKVIKTRFLKYKKYIINKSQIKGSFYNKIFK